MGVIIEFVIVPLGELSLSRYVAHVVKLLEGKRVKYQLTPMGTIIEVPTLREGLKIVEEAHEAMLGMARYTCLWIKGDFPSRRPRSTSSGNSVAP